MLCFPTYTLERRPHSTTDALYMTSFIPDSFLALKISAQRGYWCFTPGPMWSILYVTVIFRRIGEEVIVGNRWAHYSGYSNHPNGIECKSRVLGRS